jgi:rRNA maturation endonuclease Nob1
MTDDRELSCIICGEEFKLEHFAESDPTFCPFCGESLYEEVEDEDIYEWLEDDQ